MMRVVHHAGSAVILSVLVFGLPPHPAAGCTIDNVASLLADGVPAMLTTSVPRGTAPWAPFTLTQALAVQAPVRLAEAPADLARTLPRAVRTAPFRWSFGDGAIALGHVVIHRYTRPGTYRLTVSGHDQRTRRWFAFDQAVVRVVPRDQVLRTNLGFHALQVVIAVSGACAGRELRPPEN